MDTATNKELVARLLRAFEPLDMATFDEVLAPDVDWEIPGDPTLFVLAGRLAKQDLIDQLPIVFPNGIRMTPVAMTAEGARVAVEAESAGVMADGYAYSNRYHFLFEVRDGKIVTAREYCDTGRAAAMVPHMSIPATS